jgi:hypothetical protein
VGQCSEGKPWESISPLVKVMLAVAACGERYRVGHYGAITDVGELRRHRDVTLRQPGSHIDEATEGQPFPIRFFQEAILRRFCCREGSYPPLPAKSSQRFLEQPSLRIPAPADPSPYPKTGFGGFTSGTPHGRKSKASARDNGSNSCEPAHADSRRPVRRAAGKPTL